MSKWDSQIGLMNTRLAILYSFGGWESAVRREWIFILLERPNVVFYQARSKFCKILMCILVHVYVTAQIGRAHV